MNISTLSALGIKMRESKSAEKSSERPSVKQTNSYYVPTLGGADDDIMIQDEGRN